MIHVFWPNAVGKWVKHMFFNTVLNMGIRVAGAYQLEQNQVRWMYCLPELTLLVLRQIFTR
jgi:hypothetical protein